MGLRARVRLTDDERRISATSRLERSAAPTLTQCISDPNLFGPFFDRDRDAWSSWFALTAAILAEPLTPTQLQTFQKHTGRTKPPTKPQTEIAIIVGRRGGKSKVLALLAAYLATMRDYRPFLSAGEPATLIVVASDKRQAKIIFRYVLAFISETPMLSRLILREVAETLELSNGVTITINTNSFKAPRGQTIIAALCDELAFWNSETSSDPDYEVLNAIRPGTASIPGAMILMASSPWRKKGVLYDNFKRYYGREDAKTFVWRASTLDMNPTISAEFIADAYERDAISAASEYGAEWRDDLAAYLSRDVVEASVDDGVHERQRLSGTKYHAFCDPAGGGTGADSMALAIGHLDEKGVAVFDALREVRPPFSPEKVVIEFSTLLKSYGVNRVTGDKYGGDWPTERFKVHGIAYEAAGRPKSEIYTAFLSVINSKRCQLLDHQRLINQLTSLERQTGRLRDIVDHPPGQNDDLANVCAGVLSHLTAKKYRYDCSLDWILEGNADDWRAANLRQYITNGGHR